MKKILITTCLLVAMPLAAVAAPAPCPAPVKNITELYNLVAAKCSPILFDQSLAGQTLTVAASLPLAADVVLDGESKNITLQGDGKINPLIKLLNSGSTIQNITLTNPGKTVVTITSNTGNNNKLIATNIVNSNIAIYISGYGNSILQGSFAGNTSAIQLDSGNKGIQSPLVTSYQVSKTDETQWVIKGLTVNGQAVGGNVDLYLADANSATPQGKTYKASAVVAVDGSFSFTLPFKGKGTENAPYTLLVTDLAGNTSVFSGTFIPEVSADFFASVDPDGDSIFNSKDNCPAVKNFDQLDSDKDGVGDACDNCKYFANKDQADMDKDVSGDSCDEDIDGDALKNFDDNCKLDANADQKDADLDGIGDVCDQQTVVDFDKDGVPDVFDSCPVTANANQADLDKDLIGDSCDEDADADSFVNLNDNCPYISNVNQSDANNNGIGDVCETATGVVDADADGMPDAQDNCPFVKNPDQADQDADVTGNACDFDIDGDAVANEKDNCPLTANADQTNVDVDALGDACDAVTGTVTSESPNAPTAATGNSGCSMVPQSGASGLPMLYAFAAIVGGLLTQRRLRK